jgi:hypothetical protein
VVLIVAIVFAPRIVLALAFFVIDCINRHPSRCSQACAGNGTVSTAEFGTHGTTDMTTAGSR